MAERELPECPFCGKEMNVLKTNDAFFVCEGDKENKGDKDVEKDHYQTILFSQKYFPNGVNPDSREVKKPEEETRPEALSAII